MQITRSRSCWQIANGRGSANSGCLSGMPVEAFIQTGERMALSYLVKPLKDNVTRALRKR